MLIMCKKLDRIVVLTRIYDRWRLVMISDSAIHTHSCLNRATIQVCLIIFDIFTSPLPPLGSPVLSGLLSLFYVTVRISTKLSMTTTAMNQTRATQQTFHYSLFHSLLQRLVDHHTSELLVHGILYHSSRTTHIIFVGYLPAILVWLDNLGPDLMDWLENSSLTHDCFESFYACLHSFIKVNYL